MLCARSRLSAFQVATAGVFTALVIVVTLAFRVPIPMTSGGYFNLGETVIFSAALLFGPFVGLIAGSGAAIVDVMVSPGYAPVTFVLKTVEGFIVGYLLKKVKKKVKSLTLCATIVILIGGSVMVAGYFVYEMFMFDYAYALTGVPFNIIQMLAGLIVAVPTMHAVLRVFPQLESYI